MDRNNVNIENEPSYKNYKISLFYFQVLHRLLSNSVRKQRNHIYRMPYDLNEVRTKRNRNHMHYMTNRHRTNHINTSDCEDNSSGGEEDFSQVTYSFIIILNLKKYHLLTVI